MEEKMKSVLVEKAPVSDGFALTLDEWNAVKTALLRLTIRRWLKDTLEDQFFVRLKTIVFAWYVVKRMLGKETGTEAVVGDAGLGTPSHVGAKWGVLFIQEVTGDGISLWERWKGFGEKLEGRADRIQDIQSLVRHCKIAAVADEWQSPEEWIRSCIAESCSLFELFPVIHSTVAMIRSSLLRSRFSGVAPESCLECLRTGDPLCFNMMMTSQN
jgi:hypothetical protein